MKSALLLVCVFAAGNAFAVNPDEKGAAGRPADSQERPAAAGGSKAGEAPVRPQQRDGEPPRGDTRPGGPGAAIEESKREQERQKAGGRAPDLNSGDARRP